MGQTPSAAASSIVLKGGGGGRMHGPSQSTIEKATLMKDGTVASGDRGWGRVSHVQEGPFYRVENGLQHTSLYLLRR